MKTFFITLMLALTCIVMTAQSWTQQPSLPGTPRYGAASAQTSTHGYVLGGETAGGRTNECWAFDAGSQSWAAIAPYPGGLRSKTVAFQYDDIIYFGMGDINGLSDSLLYAYDPTLDSWTEISGAPAGVNFWSASCFMIGSKAYIVTFSNHVVSYDCVSGVWEMLASFPGPARSTASAFAINGLGYYGLGYPYNPPFNNDFWKYDPIQDAWTEIPGGFPGLPRYAAKGVASNSFGYVICGESQEAPVFNNDVWRFDPTTEEFSQLVDFPANRNYLSAFFIDNELYAGCGGPGWNTNWWSINPEENPQLNCQPLSGSLTNGLVGYWPFCGNANDESGNGNHGVVNGAVLAEDRFGNSERAYQFSDFTNIECPLNSTFFANDFTVSMWVKFDGYNSGNSYPTILIGQNYYLVLQFTNTTIPPVLQSFFGSTLPGQYDGLTRAEHVIGSWVHVILKTEGGISTIYFDGVPIASADAPSEYQGGTSGDNLLFGGGYQLPAENFNGLLDDITIYNRALSPEEITQLYAVQSTGVPTAGGGGNTTGPLANVPRGISYQAVARDAQGQAIVSSPVNVRFTLHEGTPTGTTEYSETHALTTNEIGLFRTFFGAGTAITSAFDSIVWSNTTKFLQVEIDLGNGYVDMGTQQLMSVPYAYRANEAAAAGTIRNNTLPVYPDNAAALAGGLVAGEMYRTATGDLKIVY